MFVEYYVREYFLPKRIFSKFHDFIRIRNQNFATEFKLIFHSSNFYYQSINRNTKIFVNIIYYAFKIDFNNSLEFQEIQIFSNFSPFFELLFAISKWISTRCWARRSSFLKFTQRLFILFNPIHQIQGTGENLIELNFRIS